MVLVRAEYTFPFLQCRNFQEIGGLLSYEDRMLSIECCVAPLDSEVFERSCYMVFLTFFEVQTGSLVKELYFQ